MININLVIKKNKSIKTLRRLRIKLYLSQLHNSLASVCSSGSFYGTCSSHKLEVLEVSESSRCLLLRSSRPPRLCHLEPSSVKQDSQTRCGFL